MKIRLTKAALHDLIEAKAFIALDNPTAAANVVRKLNLAVELIAERPGIGRSTDQKDDREWSVPGVSYLIPHRIIGEHIEIARIWHTSRRRPDQW